MTATARAVLSPSLGQLRHAVRSAISSAPIDRIRTRLPQDPSANSFAVASLAAAGLATAIATVFVSSEPLPLVALAALSGLVILFAGLRCDPRFAIAVGAAVVCGQLAANLALRGPSAAQLPTTLLLLSLTAMAAVAAQRGRQLRRSARTDPMTGLLSRDALAALVNENIEGQRGFGSKPGRVAVAVVSLDHFDDLNQEAGFEAASGILENIGALLRSGFRFTDVAARSNGERFALIFPGADVESMRPRLEGLRIGIAGQRIETASLQHVTASIGLAAWPDDGETLDAVMSEAKLRGGTARVRGNCVVSG